MSCETKSTVVGLSEPQLPVLRFGLKHLFWCFTGVCILMAALAMSPQAGMSPLALLLAVLAVALHIGGTAIGTRMREHANERRAWEAALERGSSFDEGPPCVPRPALTTVPRPLSTLHGHDRPHRRMPLCLVVGAVVGGCLGAAALVVMIGDHTSAVGVAVGAISTAVVGAWLAFVASSSWAIFRQGWRDAVAEHSRDEVPVIRAGQS